MTAWAKFVIHGREETLRGVNGTAVVPSSGPWLLKLTELPYACRDIHSQKACIIVVPRIKAPNHLLLIPGKKLVMVVVMVPATADQINSQAVLLVVVIGGRGRSGSGSN
jgi:hypothetical protein